MKPNLIHIKLRDKNIINLNRIFGLFKLSVENNTFNLNYNKNIKECSNHIFEIIYDKKYIKKNIGKMIYDDTENKEIKLYNIEFITNNMKRAKMIINNKLYKLKENIECQKSHCKIKIKFLDNIIKLNSMFSNCKSLYSIHNFKNLNTKYLKTIFELFAGCNSLSNIDDISNWNINNINNISKIFCECSKLKELPDISKWNISNVNNMSRLFYKCSKIKSLPDISIWDLSNANDISHMFEDCISLEYFPEISKWDTKEVINMSCLFHECSLSNICLIFLNGILLKLRIFMKYFIDALI